MFTLLMMDATSSVLPVDVLKNSPTWAEHGAGPRVRDVSCAARPLNAFLDTQKEALWPQTDFQGLCCAARKQDTATFQGGWASRSKQSGHALLAYLDLWMGKSVLNTLGTIAFPATLTVTDSAIMAQ